MRWLKLFFYFSLIVIVTLQVSEARVKAETDEYFFNQKKVKTLPRSELVVDALNEDNETSERITQSSNEEMLNSSDSTAKIVESEPSYQQQNRLLGDGSEISPLLVGNEDDLVNALLTVPQTGSCLFIKLTGDIVGNSWNYKFKFLYDTVLDGDGHSILYTGTNFSNAQMYSESIPNLTVTYKNLNFGNETYPNSNYYGIFYTRNSGMTDFTLNLENINYYVANGSQPFYFNGGKGSTINFSGINSFQMLNSGKNGGEFSQGVQNITVKKGSKTTISHLHTEQDIFFHGDLNAGKMNVTVEEGAVLDITTVKRNMFTASQQPEINIGESGVFKYKRINASTSFRANSNSAGIVFNFGKNSSNTIESTSLLDTGSNATNFVVNANNPNFIIFRDISTSDSKSFLSSNSSIIQFNRKDLSNEKVYNLFSLGRDNQISELNDFQTNSEYTLRGSAVPSSSGVLYQDSQSIRDAVVASADTSLNVSNIEVHLKKIERINRGMSKVTYKLGESQLYNSSQSITDKLSQESITESALGSKGFIGQKELTITDSESPNFDIEQATTAQFEKLKPGTYYLYTQIDEIVGTEAGESPVAGFNIKSKWVETIVEVPPILNVSFPVNSLAFNSYKAGEFGKSENTNGGASISSSSNVPVGVKLQAVIENEENTVKLVKEFTTRPTNELILRLNSVFESGLKGPVWGPLADSNIEDEKKVLTFQPFWGNNKEATLFLDGNFSGPSHVEQKVKYQFVFYYEDLSE